MYIYVSIMARRYEEREREAVYVSYVMAKASVTMSQLSL